MRLRWLHALNIHQALVRLLASKPVRSRLVKPPMCSNIKFAFSTFLVSKPLMSIFANGMSQLVEENIQLESALRGILFPLSV